MPSGHSPALKGTGILKVAADDLVGILQSLPRSYRLVGSAECLDLGFVKVVLESEDLATGGLTIGLEVQDAGSTRIVRIVARR